MCPMYLCFYFSSVYNLLFNCQMELADIIISLCEKSILTARFIFFFLGENLIWLQIHWTRNEYTNLVLIRNHDLDKVVIWPTINDNLWTPFENRHYTGYSLYYVHWSFSISYHTLCLHRWIVGYWDQKIKGGTFS